MNELVQLKPNKRNSLILLLSTIILLLIIIVGYLFWLMNIIDDKGRSAPEHPLVTEQLTQARSLQKQGKLADAAIVFERYAMQGYPEAMFYAAKAYSKGWGVAPDLDKARFYLLSAVEFEFSYRGESAYQLGKLYQTSQGPDCNTIAVQWFNKALKWNYVKALLPLATHYENGLGVEQDTAKASSYYQKGVENGITIAAIKYARLLMNPTVGGTNPVLAKSLISYAVEQLSLEARSGNPSSAKTLGRLYRDGNLLDRDNKLAIHWLTMASNLGDEGSMHDLGQLWLFINDENALQNAITWLKKSANMGHGGAATALGRLYLSEKYNFDKLISLSWFEKGVVAGHGGSMQELAKIYYEGKLVEKDEEKAINLLENGVKLGHSGSKRLLNEYQKS